MQVLIRRWSQYRFELLNRILGRKVGGYYSELEVIVKAELRAMSGQDVRFSDLRENRQWKSSPSWAE